ncbi:hypothetical protein PPTG_08540 [Phytophthora nicotianae INRA-310]|uniref:Uncharacterized protein n=1 Tax=Phytophthora nicotianae (strain INRA-310) TaxID=761204 RepID=W2QL40_PHYN3|nr:hypothetical protein PPTG_08540 [Phytophthora nicotianae INRA-310]ETN13843.1 hypothetical protein PPTG_08540 [Phytophthora nicotianae INRA-310]
MRANNAVVDKVLELSEERKHLQQVLNRYLSNPDDIATLFATNIRNLREEIDTLEQQRQHLRTSRALEPPNDVWRAAAEYCRLIRHGLHLTSNQLGFMRDMMSPNVVFNAAYGPEAIMQHWFFMNWFGEVDVELKGWELTDGNSLVAITTTSVTITKHTLRNVFPHLRTIDNSDRNGKLAEQLLLQRLVMRGSTRFEWDDSTCRVTRVIAQSDMMTPILHLLGNLEDVSRVFEQALISPEFQWNQMLYHNPIPLRCSSPTHSPVPRLY